jgi:cytosine deaminase
VEDLLLRGGHVWGHGIADVLVQDGRIAGIARDLLDEDAETVDLGGRLVLPGLVDAHAHLDKTLFGAPWTPHSASDDLADRIGNERRRRGELGLPRAASMAALLERMVTSGTAHLRTHTDVAPDLGLRHVEAVGEAAARMAGLIDVTQVAFPQNGLLLAPGTAELLEQALRGGVGAIGGLDPSTEGDPVRYLDVVFGLAERHGARVDLHLHDPGALGAWELELIAARTVAAGLQGRVTVSHAYALGQVDRAQQQRLAERLAEAQVTITTAAVYSYPVPPLALLREAGVNVACGNDGVRDLWGPYGTGDMLDRAMHVAYRSGWRRDEDIELALQAATSGGATALGLAGYGLTPGAPADLVVLSAGNAAEAVVGHPIRDLVLKQGRIVARDGRLQSGIDSPGRHARH